MSVGILPAVPGRKDGQPNKPGQGAPKKPEEEKRKRWVIYVKDADKALVQAFAKAQGIELRERQKRETAAPQDKGL